MDDEKLLQSAGRAGDALVKANDGYGLSVRQLASILGVSPSTLHRDLKKAPGYEPDEDGRITVMLVKGRDGKIRPGRRVDTTARDLAIYRMRRDKASIREIAKTVGCSVGTVHRVLNAY